MFDRIFLAHPRTVGETYREHATIAIGFGSAMVAAGLKCLVHALLPVLFPTAASDRVRSLHDLLEKRRAQVADCFPEYVI